MPTKKPAKTKPAKAEAAKGITTEADISKLIKRAKEESEKHKKSIRQGEHFEALDEAGLRKKLQRVNSPFINSHAWTTNVAPGGTISISVGFFNPDPVAQNELFVYMFVGSSNPVTDNGMFLLNVDNRYPRLAQPAPFGVNLAPSTGSSVSFSLRVPSNMEPGTYLCNFVLLKRVAFDPGTIFDRSMIVFRVT